MTLLKNYASHVIIPVCFRAGIYLLFRICSTIGISVFHFSVRNGKRWGYAIINTNFVLVIYFLYGCLSQTTFPFPILGESRESAFLSSLLLEFRLKRS